jgi:hypothetical protein
MLFHIAGRLKVEAQALIYAIGDRPKKVPARVDAGKLADVGIEAEQLERVGDQEVLQDHEGHIGRAQKKDAELQPGACHLLVVRSQCLPN